MTDDIDPGTHCPFPKHRGKSWAKVVSDDPEYAEWLVSGSGPDMADDMYDAITDAIENELEADGIEPELEP